MCSRPTPPAGDDVGISRLTVHSTPCSLPRLVAGRDVSSQRGAAVARTITVSEEAYEALKRYKRNGENFPRPCSGS